MSLTPSIATRIAVIGSAALIATLGRALKDLHSSQRTFTGADNWSTFDEDARAQAEQALDQFEAYEQAAPDTTRKLAGALRALATKTGDFQPGVTDPQHLTRGPVAEQVRGALAEFDALLGAAAPASGTAA